MANISSKTSPLLNTNLKIAIYISSYFLFIGVILAIGISICIYIDRRQQRRPAISDEERNSSGVQDEKVALLPSQPQSHQTITNLQSRTDVSGNFSPFSSNYGATDPLSVLDKRTGFYHTINKPAELTPHSATETTADSPKYFTKYGMKGEEPGTWLKEMRWDWKLGGLLEVKARLGVRAKGRKDKEQDAVSENSPVEDEDGR